MISRLLDREGVFLLFVFYLLVGYSWFFLLAPLEEDKELILPMGLLILTLALFGLLKRFLPKGQYPVFFLSFWMLTFYKSFISPSVSVSLVWILYAFILFPMGEDQPKEKTKLFYSGFFIGLAGLFFPPTFLYIVWLALALLLNGEKNLKNWLICLMGLLAPVWIYLSVLYLLDSMNMSMVDRYLSFLYFSSFPLDIYFYLFCIASIFCLGGIVEVLLFSKRQKPSSKKIFKHYLLTAFPGLLILLFYSRDTGQYAFLMVPSCFILSSLLTQMKNQRMKESVSWIFVAISVFCLSLRIYQ